MKSIFAALTIAGLAVSLSSCAHDEPTRTTSSTTVESTSIQPVAPPTTTTTTQTTAAPY